MLRIAHVVLLLPCFALSPAAEAQDKAGTPAEQYQALLAQFEDSGNKAEFAPRFLEFATQHTKDPAAVDALTWIVENFRYKPQAAQAMELLEKVHLNSPRLAEACRPVSRALSPTAAHLLQEALSKSPHQPVRAQAALQLAWLLKEQMRLADRVKQQPEARPQVEQYYGKNLSDHLFALDAKRAEEQLIAVYEQMQKSLADAPAADETLGELAAKELFAIRHLAVGKVAPEIQGEDIDGRKFKLSDYRGKVVMLSFWADW